MASGSNPLRAFLYFKHDGASMLLHDTECMNVPVIILQVSFYCRIHSALSDERTDMTWLDSESWHKVAPRVVLDFSLTFTDCDWNRPN